MKTNTKILLGIGIAAAATTVIAIGVLRELRAIRNLTIDVDDLPEDEPADEAVEEAAIEEEAVIEEEADEAVEEPAEAPAETEELVEVIVEEVVDTDDGETTVD